MRCQIDYAHSPVKSASGTVTEVQSGPQAGATSSGTDPATRWAGAPNWPTVVLAGTESSSGALKGHCIAAARREIAGNRGRSD